MPKNKPGIVTVPKMDYIAVFCFTAEGCLGGTIVK